VAGLLDDAHLPGLYEYSVAIQPATVITNFDHDVASLMASSQANMPEWVLAGSQPLLLGFQSMINCITNHVHERIGEFFNDISIKFGFRANELQLHLLSSFSRKVSDETIHFLEEPADWDHAHGHRGLLQFGCDSRHLRQAVENRGTVQLG